MTSDLAVPDVVRPTLGENALPLPVKELTYRHLGQQIVVIQDVAVYIGELVKVSFYSPDIVFLGISRGKAEARIDGLKPDDVVWVKR